MQCITKHNFLPETWLDFVRGEVRKFEGVLSRDGYHNKKTYRDFFDPRSAETKFIDDPRNILNKVWDKFLWGTDIEEEMARAEDSALVHATLNKCGVTLLSSYGDNDNYGYHVDTDLNCVATAVLMLTLTKEPKFRGGSLYIGNQEHKFENNKLIIFPSCRKHAVARVKLDEDKYENRRFTLQYFISSIAPRKRFPDESYPE